MGVDELPLRADHAMQPRAKFRRVLVHVQFGDAVGVVDVRLNDLLNLAVLAVQRFDDEDDFGFFGNAAFPHVHAGDGKPVDAVG